MWIATAQDQCRRLRDDPDFLRSNLYVFEGEATVEDDKLTLVEPILGLRASRAPEVTINGRPPTLRLCALQVRGALRADALWPILRLLVTSKPSPHFQIACLDGRWWWAKG